MNSEMGNGCEKCGGAGCGNCGNCHACKGGSCTGMSHKGWFNTVACYKIRAMVILALFALALWGLVEAASGIKEFKYIGTGINPTNTISVDGSGKIFAVADTATFSFTVSETGKNVGDAQNTVTEKMDNIISYLKDSAGVEDRDIQTTSYNAYPKYDEVVCVSGAPCNRDRQIVGYTVSETVTVKVRDTEKAGDVLSGVGSRGVSNVSSLSFTVDDEELLKEKARAKAITNARAKADTLAKDLGVSLVRVVGYYDNSPGPYYYGKTMSAMGGDSMMEEVAPSANIQLGENTIQSNVTILYEIR